MENFVEVELLIDDAAELAAEAICPCGGGMPFTRPIPFPTE